MSIFVASFYHESCHISKISMDETRARLDILILFIEQSCFCHVSVTRGAVRQIRGRISCRTPDTAVPKSRQEQTTHGHRRLQCALINRNELGRRDD